MTVQKIRSGRITSVDADEYVGERGIIFYNEELGDLRLSDGVTVGGILLSGGGAAVPINGSNTVYTDNLIELHAPPGGVGASWSSNDGKDIGFRMHYFDTIDKNAALVLAQDTGYLEWYSSGTETSGVFTGTYGTIKSAGLKLNSTGKITFGDFSEQTTAWTGTALANTLGGTTLNSTVVNSSLTSVGTLSNLTVTNTITGSITGNAATVTNGVYTSASYTNPSWISSLDYGKLINVPIDNDSSYLTASSLSVTTNSAVSGGSLSYSNGVFTFTPPLLPAAQVQSDWNATTGMAVILNKPTTVTVNGTAITLGSNGTVTADANTLSNNTLNSTVVYSSLTSVGTVTNGAWCSTIGSVSGANLFDVKLNLDANENLYIGSLSSGGQYNLAIGLAALCSNMYGNYNIALGAATLSGNTEGQNNVAIGYLALCSNMYGNYNIALGADTLSGNIYGDYNTAIGASALQCNTDGVFNLAIGAGALLYNTSGNFNSALGSEALLFNTVGEYNTAIGACTLLANTVGNCNLALGSYALNHNTSGSSNIAIGSKALFLNTVGSGSTGIGASSLYNNTTGSNNIAVGCFAGCLISTGSGNTIIGNLPGTAGLTSTVIIGAGATERIRVDGNDFCINGALYAGGSGITTVGTLTSGTWNGGVISPTYGGTGTNNGSSTLSLAGSVTHAGAFTQTFTASGNTSVTLPTTGTLATLTGSETLTTKTITGSSIGSSSPSTGAFTTIAANSTVTFTSTTDASALGTAPVVLSGGLSVAKAMYIGTNITGSGVTTSSFDGFNIDGGTF